MSREYTEYIDQHRKNVRNAFRWLENNLSEIFTNDDVLNESAYQCVFKHDASKEMDVEYDAYDAYFYGKNRSYAVVNNFNHAWLHHIHNNPHHWQYWVLINDDPDKGEIVLDMPDHYIIEMICDWWSFSWNKGNLTEIFTWYDEHSKYMKLSDNTRKKVEDILNKIRTKLVESDVNGEKEAVSI